MNFTRKILDHVVVPVLECYYQYPTNMYFVSTGTHCTDTLLLVLVLLKAELKINLGNETTNLQQSNYSATILKRKK